MGLAISAGKGHIRVFFAGELNIAKNQAQVTCASAWQADVCFARQFGAKPFNFFDQRIYTERELNYEKPH